MPMTLISSTPAPLKEAIIGTACIILIYVAVHILVRVRVRKSKENSTFEKLFDDITIKKKQHS